MKINLIIHIILMFYYLKASNSVKIEKIAGPNYLSEGPHWDVINKVLYFVDIPSQRVYCFNPETNKTTSTYIKNGPVGVVVPVAEKKNSFIAGSGDDLVQVTWDPKTNNENPDIKLLTKVDINKNVTRFNDGKVDPMGRFWAGTIGQAGGVLFPNEGTLYKFDAHYTPVAILNETSISNGLTWSHDNKTFYWIDTLTDNIYSFVYNMESGNIKNSVPGHPDGMTIDKNGNLWVACYNGKRVIQIDPNTGELLRQIEMPVDQITSVAFGGTNLDILYVTSGRENLDEQQIAKQPMAGSVFAIYDIGTVGVPMLDCRSLQEVEIKKVAGPFDLAEGPHWDDLNQVLYFVDLMAETIHAYDPVTTKVTKAIINNGPVGFIIPVAGKNNTFIAGSGTDLVQITWDPKIDNSYPDFEILTTVDVEKSNTRFNDGKVDSFGRLWAGTMGHIGNTFPPNQGSLYRFGADFVPNTMASSITISNGLAWSHDNKIFYFIDSPTYEVFAYDFDEETGDISNKRTIFSFIENGIPGIPDGMTIDKSGNLWIACYDGGMVIQINPKTTKLMRRIEVPSKETTSVAFGGKNRDVLYVTSARQKKTEDNKHEQPMAGCLFEIHGLGETGNPMTAVKI